MPMDQALDFIDRRGGKLVGQMTIPYRCQEALDYLQRQHTIFANPNLKGRKRKRLLLEEAKRFRESMCSCEGYGLIRYELSDRLLGPPPKDAPPRPKLPVKTETRVFMNTPSAAADPA